MTTEMYYCSPNFVTDFDKLHEDANNYQEDMAKLYGGTYVNSAGVTVTVSKQDSDVGALNQEITSLVGKYRNHPDELLAILIVKVLGSDRDKVFQMKLQVKADAVQIQADVTKCTNDIQGTITKYSGEHKTTFGDAVAEVAADCDEMCNVLGVGSTLGVQSTSVAAWAGEVSGPQGALGTQGSSMLYNNFLSVRHTILWNIQGSQPDPESAYNPTVGENKNIAFQVHGTSGQYLTSFYEMGQGLKDPSAPLHSMAESVNTILVNNYNQTTSATQSLGTAVNSEIGLITSAIKGNTSAESAFMQDLLTGNRTAVNDQIPR